jgi:hypothetical protein
MKRFSRPQLSGQAGAMRRWWWVAVAGLAIAGALASVQAPAAQGQAGPAAMGQAVIDGRATVVQVVQAMTGAAVAAVAGPSVDVGSATGAPGAVVTFAVTLSTAGELVAAMQADIAFDSLNTPVAATGTGRPDCMVNPAIGKESTLFTFQPNGCVGAACTAFRAVVLSFSNFDPIPDGSVLYTCNVAISPGAAAGTYPLTISNFILATPDGQQVPGVVATDGAITVERTPAPASKEQCKNGGWRNFTSPRTFKNQGDCIQFVNTGK